MNKKFIALILLSTILTLSFTGCSGSNEENKSETSKNSDASASSLSEKSSGSSDSNLVYWYNQKNWKELSGTYDGTLLTAKVKAPIDISKLDEYNSSPYHWFPNGVDGRNAKSINEILSSDEMQTPSGTPTSIGTQSAFDEKWLDLDLEDDGIASIQIYNYNENDNKVDNSISISDCYKNNWWSMSLNYEALGVSSEVQDNDYQIERADGLVKVLGTPTYIINEYGTREQFEQSIKTNEGAIYYSMVYDFDEYVLKIFTYEHVMNEYNSAMLTIEKIEYFTKESWEQESKEIDKNNIINLK